MKVKDLRRRLKFEPGDRELRVATAEADKMLDCEMLTSVEEDVAGRLVLVGEHLAPKESAA